MGLRIILQEEWLSDCWETVGLQLLGQLGQLLGRNCWVATVGSQMFESRSEMWKAGRKCGKQVENLETGQKHGEVGRKCPKVGRKCPKVGRTIA